ncbi:MAG: ATP-binding protein [Deltaproteobacteria bacterium]|jgi:hypothetical protein|nr:ATP-binding protein [Deltaproteobacteria bacterium]
MKKLPIGVQTFKKIIEGGYAYADKTKFVYDLACSNTAYFLSRPRRFGKSLLLNTFKALFSGPPNPDGPPQGLFADLWIGRESDYDFTQTHPVITFSMSSDSDSPADLRESILKKLDEINQSEQLGLNISLPATDLFLLIKRLKEKYDKEVVVLIDEYDAPVSGNIDNPDLALKNRDILRNFYSGFKDTDEFLRFVFVTGVTRYVFMGLSAGLNHLMDLTLESKYANICGFTLQELKHCFANRLPALLRAMKKAGNMPKNATLKDMWREIGLWYDGYSWDGKNRLYNPYSLLNLFRGESFESFWMNQDPSAKTLSNILAKDPLAITGDRFKNLTTTQIGLAEVGSLAPVPALFQTGMLTIDEINYNNDRSKLFTLRLPNKEISPNFYSKFSSSLNKYFNISPKTKSSNFLNYLKNNDEKNLSTLINSIFGSIPAIHHRARESYYHSVLHGYLYDMPGAVISLAEHPGSIGTPDIVIIFNDGARAVIELKYETSDDDDPGNDENELAGRKTRTGPSEEEIRKILTKLALLALDAIENKKYAQPYEGQAKDIIKIGLGIYGRGRSLAIIKR